MYNKEKEDEIEDEEIEKKMISLKKEINDNGDEFNNEIYRFIEESNQTTRINIFQKSSILYLILLSVLYIIIIFPWIFIMTITTFIWMRDTIFYYFIFIMCSAVSLFLILFISNFIVLIFVNKCYIEKKIKKFGVNI